MVAGDQIFELATLIETSSGSSFVQAAVDDANPANAATIVGEGGASVAGPDVSFAGISWGVCPCWRSGLITASNELVRDSGFDLANLIATASGARLAKGIGSYFISVLLGDSVAGLTSASSTAVTSDELSDLVASVDSAYAQNGSWLMRFSTLQAIWKLKASTGGQILFPPVRDDSGHFVLLGFPVFLSPNMGGLIANAKSISFGDHSKFFRRQVQNGLQVNVFSERYAEYYRTAYETYLRCDGHLLKAPDFGSPVVSQSPTKFILMKT